MVKRMRKGFVIGFVLALLLAACGGGAPQPQMEESDFNTSISNFTSTASAVASEATQDLSLAALQELYSRSSFGQSLTVAVSELASLSRRNVVSVSEVEGLLQSIIPSFSELPREKWVWDSVNSGWQKASSYSGNHLIFEWTFENNGSHTAVLDIDWAHGQPTKKATTQNGTEVEVPQDVYITLKIDGRGNDYFEGRFKWYSGECGTIMEPTSVVLKSHIGSSVSLDLYFDYQVASNSITSKGSVTLKSDNDSAGIKWDVAANGKITRGEDCFMKEFEVADGHVKVEAFSTTSDGRQSVEFYTNFAINYSDDGQLDSVNLSNGYLTLNGEVAFTFDGVLDDENGNGIPGENVTVRFADGSKTLEQVLSDSGFSGISSYLPSY